MTSVISARGLQKRYGRTQALDGLDLDVTEGEVHGFLGPNGAGKSTTIRVLLGLYRATAGRVRVLGIDPGAPEWANSGDAASEQALAMLVGRLLVDRSDARTEKDWATADRIRAELSAAGITIEDTPTGAHWSLES